MAEMLFFQYTMWFFEKNIIKIRRGTALSWKGRINLAGVENLQGCGKFIPGLL